MAEALSGEPVQVILKAPPGNGREWPDNFVVQDFLPLVELLPYVGRAEIALPVVANNAATGGKKATAVVIQHPADGIEDGHEVVFQTDPPKHQYSCFLATFARGTPIVPNDGAATAACPPAP